MQPVHYSPVTRGGQGIWGGGKGHLLALGLYFLSILNAWFGFPVRKYSRTHTIAMGSR